MALALGMQVARAFVVRSGCRALSAAAAPNAKRYEGRVAIVTASTAGIGLGIAKRLAQEGANVVLSSRRESNLDAALASLRSEGLEVAGTVCHVGRAEQRRALLEYTLSTFGRIDVLVSNAAVNPTYGPTLDTDEAAWDKIFEINVKAAFLLVKEAMPHLRETKGNVLFVSSIAGYTPLSNLGPYSVSKTALLGLTKVLAQECGDFGVRVNCLAPGIIETEFSRALYEDPKVHEALMRDVPIRRLGRPSDMAATAAFLCSDDAAYVTGETLVAAGGMPSHL